jgi:prephenate dehydrogenase
MKLALIGVGLIGGSFASALREAGEVDQVIGYDTDSRALSTAIARGIVTGEATSAAAAAADADVIVIATPVGAIRSTLAAIALNLRPDAVLTDVGSTKCSVIEDAHATLGPAAGRFVPIHPIAGGERPGVEHADPDLFRGKLVISTPNASTDPQALACIEQLWSRVGAKIERLDPEEHDRIFAAVSHLPHLLAFALVAMIAKEPDVNAKFAHAGAGFRDFTRIAASSPEMWRDVCLANRDHLISELRSYADGLDRLLAMIETSDAAALHEVFAIAAGARRAIAIDCSS